MKKKISTVLLMTILLLAYSLSAFAHSGRTDSSGGHRDNKNASGLGYYHYHHGYGPHLHPNGVCPYETSVPASAPVAQKEVTPVVPEPINIIINGEIKTFSPAPINDAGNILVPLRAIFESMGASVSWDQATQVATAAKNDKTVVLKIGSTQATINGNKHSLSTKAKIVNGQTMAPLRFVGEAFGGTVTWDSGTRTANISY